MSQSTKTTQVNNTSVKYDTTRKLKVGNVGGAAVSQSVNTIYQATEDRIVECLRVSTSATASVTYDGGGLVCKSDSSTPPTTEVTGVAILFGIHTGTFVAKAGTSFFVKKNDYYVVSTYTVLGTHSDVDTVIYYPIGS